MNTEHLFEVFTTADANSNDVWAACGRFAAYLSWHKPRLAVLGSKIEGFPNNHLLKPWCLLKLLYLIVSVGNYPERKQLFIHTLEFWKEQGDDLRVVRTLRHLSDANRMLGLFEEGV